MDKEVDHFSTMRTIFCMYPQHRIWQQHKRQAGLSQAGAQNLAIISVPWFMKLEGNSSIQSHCFWICQVRASSLTKTTCTVPFEQTKGGNGPQWITSCKSRYNLAVAPTPLLQSPTLQLLQKQGLSFVFIMARGDDTDPRPLMIANFALDCISNDFRDFITPQKQSTSTVQTWRHAQWDQIRKNQVDNWTWH